MSRKTLTSFSYSLIFLFSYFFIFSSPVHAATWGSCVVDDAATIQCIIPMVERVIQGVLALSGVALFVMLVIGGYNFLLSGGEQKKLEMARGTITGAIIGIVIMAVAYLIIKTIASFTGVGSLTQFDIPM